MEIKPRIGLVVFLAPIATLIAVIIAVIFTAKDGGSRTSVSELFSAVPNQTGSPYENRKKSIRLIRENAGTVSTMPKKELKTMLESFIAYNDADTLITAIRLIDPGHYFSEYHQ